jgi:alpha-glucosidase
LPQTNGAKAVAAQNYDAYNNGLEADIFLKKADGSVFKGKVWPGVTAFPDWFHSNTQRYWNDEFTNFFNAKTGVDIDALWIDMNEPANFCDYPCDNPEAQSEVDTTNLQGIEYAPIGSHESEKVHREEEVTPGSKQEKSKREIGRAQLEGREVGDKKGLPGRDLINPSYKIKNELGSLSNRTAHTDLIHQGGWAEYDTHNL